MEEEDDGGSDEAEDETVKEGCIDWGGEEAFGSDEAVLNCCCVVGLGFLALRSWDDRQYVCKRRVTRGK